jgi:leucyl aminopeptidase (aminopeptidase T)
MAALEGTDKVLLTSAKGTNLELCIKGRPINTDIKADASGLFSNFPPGEVYIAPQESQTQGRLVLDGAIGLFGDGGYPLRMDVIDGRAQIDSMHFDNLPGNKQFYYDSIRHFFTDCPNGNIVAELGIGAADYPVRGNISSDEKIFGSVHLGFGNNHFLGGEIHSATHIDAMIYAPTIVLVKPDGSRLLLMENGQLRI